MLSTTILILFIISLELIIIYYRVEHRPSVILDCVLVLCFCQSDCFVHCSHLHLAHHSHSCIPYPLQPTYLLTIINVGWIQSSEYRRIEGIDHTTDGSLSPLENFSRNENKMLDSQNKNGISTQRVVTCRNQQSPEIQGILQQLRMQIVDIS